MDKWNTCGESKMSLSNLLANFAEPAAEFRGAPFWAWNAGLEPEKLRSQIRNMKDMGMGGFFMHSRVGLATTYLGKEWFDCIRVCIEEAGKLGMSAWLYDEDRWPSGAAGGIVTADDRFKMKQLYMERGKITSAGEQLALYAARFDNDKVLEYRRVAAPDEALPGEELIRCYYDFAARSGAFNGETYLDTLNKEAAAKFIEVTHEAYYREFEKYFGREVPGIFTDEPCYWLPYQGEVNLPWTCGFEKLFLEKYRYDICDFLPELYFSCKEKVSKVRYHYYGLLTGLFVDAFARQTGQWCSDHNAALTGHVLWEDDLDGHTSCVGNAMRFYEHMQIPGIDLLTEHWLTPATAKQCTSVARQLGRKRRLSEMYGCTGWDFPLAGHKALGDWQYAMGINFRCHHLYWYSMEAEAKRDYPATISGHSPWHTVYSKLEDHFARLGSVLAEGEEIRDILVIHPMESAWCIKYRMSKDMAPEMKKLNEEFITLANTLLAENLDFDYGDEELLARYASCEGTRLRVGKAVYKAVVIPELETIRSSTLKLLKEFAANGGKVLCFEHVPQHVDAERVENAEELFAGFEKCSMQTAASELAVFRRVSMTIPDGRQAESLLYHYSSDGENPVLFVCNTSVGFSADCMTLPMVRDRRTAYPAVRIAVSAPAGKHLYELDTFEGTVKKVQFSFENGQYIFDSSFDVLASRLFLFSSQELPQAADPGSPQETSRQITLEQASLQIVRDEPNVLILDHADITVDGKEFARNFFILKADDRLRKLLGASPRGGAMLQPYMTAGAGPEKCLDLKLDFHFECTVIPEKPCRLVIERPELYRIFLNGTELSSAPDGFWTAPELQTIEIPSDRLNTGKNILTCRTQYHEYLPGLESLFILGEFSVKDNTMYGTVSTLEYGDWCRQGFPWYGGNMSYILPLDKVPADASSLEIPEWRGAALGISINGGEEKLFFTPPYRMPLDGLLKRDGSDHATVKIYGHRRNVFGPFYGRDQWPSWTGPAAFKVQEISVRQSVPCGMLQNAVINCR